MLADKKDNNLTLTPEEPILTTSTDATSQDKDKAKVTKKDQEWKDDPNGAGVNTVNDNIDANWNEIIRITDLSELPNEWWAVTDKKMYKFIDKNWNIYNFFGNKRAANTDTQKIDSRDVIKKEIEFNNSH